MVDSHNTEHGTRTELWTRIFGRFTRYDLLLFAVPVVFVVGIAAGVLGPTSPEVTVGVAAVVNAAIVLDGLYFNPPVGRESGDSPGPETGRLRSD
jgi:hypothetical protein